MTRSKLLFMLVLVMSFLIFGCSNESDVTRPNDEQTAFAPSGTLLEKAGSPLIVSANLHVYAQAFNNQTVTVHGITAPWDEMVVTFANFGGAFAPAVSGAFVADAAGWKTADVTALVQAWLDDPDNNNGLLLDQDSAATPRSRFTSREGTTNHPYLEVVYATAFGNHTVTLADMADAYIWGSMPDLNTGDRPILYAGRSPSLDLEKQSLLKFDTSGIPELGALGDRVWLDANEDGLQDGNEIGIPGITVNLFDCDDVLLATTMTDAAGLYLFDLLPAGDYRVGFVVPEGYEVSPMNVGIDDEIDSDADPVTGLTACVSLTTGEVNLSVDAGLFMPVVEECNPCDGKVSELTLRYDGTAATFLQIYDDKNPNADKLMFEGMVDPGEEIVIYGTRREGEMGSEIALYEDGDLAVKIHTSCSRPIGPGMTFGNYYIVEGYSRNGGLLCPLDDPGTGGEWCEVGKARILTILYTGEDCSASSHNQAADKVQCEGDPAFMGTVHIVALDKENPDDDKAKVFFDGEVALDTTFELDAANAGESKLKAKTFVFVYDLSGNLLQFVEFHTSCSQPLTENDQFGSLRLVGFTPEN